MGCRSMYVLLVVLLAGSALAGCAPATTFPPESTAVVAAATRPAESTSRPSAARPDSSPATPPLDADPGAPGLGDSLYPGFGNGGYDVQHYTLDLSLRDVAASRLDGVATIAAVATQDLSSLNLDFYGFDIEEVTVDGQPATFERQGQELTIRPAAPLAEGAGFIVAVVYHGVPEEMLSVAIPVPTGWVTFDGGSFVVSEPDGAANYYPVNDHPLDKASYTFRVTVPEPYEVVANGVLEETLDNGSSTTFIWEARDPMASYLTTVNIGDFDLETMAGPDGLPIRNYYAAGLDEQYREPFARQAAILELYGELFGPYPFEVYGAVVVDAEVGTALECQTLSLFGVDQIDLGDIPETELVVAHEAAHQWFGNSIGLADWGDIWLNESFATYAEGLWIEHTEGREALDDWVEDLYWYVADSGGEMSPPGRPPADDLFNGGVYSWGALGLHALRLEVGDATFFDVLQTYCDRFAGGNVTTSDFVAVAESVSGRDLQGFFQEWLYGDDVAPIPSLGLAPQ